MIQKELYKIYHFLYELIPTFINCKRSGLPFDPTWVIKGKPRIITRKWYDRFFRHLYGGKLIIGKGFHCNNNVTSNTIGLIQPCVFNIAQPDCVLKIGNNVGISGSTINAANSIIIEDNVLIGSGCVITDTDSHPVDYDARIADQKEKVHTAPVHIGEGVFVGARSIILKGVTIGAHSIIGAGSVVSCDIPAGCIACGNPARVIKKDDNYLQEAFNVISG